MSKLTKTQRRVLERIASGEEFGPRMNYTFCPTERRYVNVFKSDMAVISQSTLFALVDHGYIHSGTSYRELTYKGREALREQS